MLSPRFSRVDVLLSSALLVKAASGVKPHLVETLLGVVIQHQLANAAAIKLATDALSTVQLKVSDKIFAETGSCYSYHNLSH